MELYVHWVCNCPEWLFTGWSPFSLLVGHLFIYLLVITVAWTVPVWWYTALLQGNLKERISVSIMDFTDLHSQAAGLCCRGLLWGWTCWSTRPCHLKFIQNKWREEKQHSLVIANKTPLIYAVSEGLSLRAATKGLVYNFSFLFTSAVVQQLKIAFHGQRGVC